MCSGSAGAHRPHRTSNEGDVIVGTRNRSGEPPVDTQLELGTRQGLKAALPEGKLYYRIGEVSRITGVKPYVLRYWESEFRWMSPHKSRSKQRLYRRKDIEMILLDTLVKDRIGRPGHGLDM